MSTENLIGFVVYAAVLAIVGVVLILWLYPLILPERNNIRKIISALTAVILVMLALLRLLGVVTWPI